MNGNGRAHEKPLDDRERGHAAHTQDAASAGLPGVFSRPIKLTFLGAGSSFAPRLINDLMRIPGNKGGTVALVDVDTERLRTMHELIRKLAARLGAKDWKIVASPQRKKVLRGTDYLISCIEVSGLSCVRIDNDIPARYGIDQCIGDTIGPGGLFKGLRTIPEWLAVLKDAERYCPEAIVLNYTNPMNMLCLAAGRTSSMQVVGLCHSVQGTSKVLAQRAGVPYEEMEWECAGINHLAWFTKLRHQGKDLYPLLKRKARGDISRALREAARGREAKDVTNWVPPVEREDLIRKDMMLHFGAFITESSGHLSEYLPYYRKNSEILKLYAREGYDGTSSFYADNWPQWRQKADDSRMAMLSGEESIDWERSWEYATWIIEAREKNVPFCIHGNVMNSRAGGDTLISNLPANGCVEVACMVDRNGVQPVRYGALPPQMAALCTSNMSMFDLGAQAAIEKSVDLAIYALLLDPLTAAVCNPAAIKKMTVEMFKAQEEYLKGYR
ncbi:MAG: alpha-glucosidase/alpha-galactosidase [Verrucomicrobiota bacterium JB024]|nr:alpha-glucosidase/alpha-galactosidase [Verrucomicrobiota bacterium JB024]